MTALIAAFVFAHFVLAAAAAAAVAPPPGRPQDEPWLAGPRRAEALAARLAQRPIVHSTCAQCRGVFRALSAAVAPPNYTTTRAAVTDACFDVFGETTAGVRCVELGLDVLAALAYLRREAEEQAWEIPATTCAALGLCRRPCCAAPDVPEQRHLSFASRQTVGPSTAVRVSWVTLRRTPGAVVQWRIAGTPRWHTAPEAHPRTYTAGGWVGFVHSAVMAALRPASLYEYRVGAPNATMSRPTTFRTLPLNAGTSERPLRVVTYGDLGYGPASDGTVRHVTRLVDRGEVDFIVHHGDLSYADGDEAHWDILGRKVDPITSRVPYMTAPGNHEAVFDFAAYKARMWMPVAEGAAPGSLYYRFDAGNVTFLVLDSERFDNTPFLSLGQVSWLDRQLALADLERRTVVLHQHRPYYCSNNDQENCGRDSEYLRQRAEAVLDAHPSLRLVMQGHEHSYERTLPIAANFTRFALSYDDPPYPTYVVSGAAGSREMFDDFDDARPWYSARRMLRLGVTALDVTRSRGRAVLAQRFVLANGTVADAFTIRTRY